MSVHYTTRFDFESRKWEYGYWLGSVFVVLAKYPDMMGHMNAA